MRSRILSRRVSNRLVAERKVPFAHPTRTGRDNGHWLKSQPSGMSFRFHVLAVSYRAAERAGRVPPFRSRFGSNPSPSAGRLDDLEAGSLLALRSDCLQRDKATPLLAHPGLLDQRNGALQVGFLQVTVRVHR